MPPLSVGSCYLCVRVVHGPDRIYVVFGQALVVYIYLFSFRPDELRDTPIRGRWLDIY